MDGGTECGGESGGYRRHGGEDLVVQNGPFGWSAKLFVVGVMQVVIHDNARQLVLPGIVHVSQHPDWPTVKWNKFTHQIRPMRRSWILEFESKHPGFNEWVQTHQLGYYGGGSTEEMDQIWWEYTQDLLSA